MVRDEVSTVLASGNERKKRKEEEEEAREQREREREKRECVLSINQP